MKHTEYNPNPIDHICECSDPGCPAHRTRSECKHLAVTTLYRIDMEDLTGTLMCEECAEDAMSFGLFRE